MMLSILLVALNEIAAFATILVMFPGLVDPDERDNFRFVVIMMFLMSYVWWLYVLVSPVTFLIGMGMGHLKWSDWMNAWPLCRLPKKSR